MNKPHSIIRACCVRSVVFVFRLLSVLLALSAGASFMFWLFIDVLPLGAPSPVLSQPHHGPYIDLHVHTAGLGAGGSGCFVSKQLADSYKLYFYLYALGVTETEVRKEGDQIILKRISERLKRSTRVGKAVVLAEDGVIDEHGELDRSATEFYVPNEFLAAELKNYDNLLFGASVNPYRPDALARLVSAKRAGAVLVKWNPALMHIDPADKRLIPFYLALIELHLPLLTHTGDERAATRARNEFSDPKRLELPLRLGVTVIAAHLASLGSIHAESNFERLLPLFARYHTLYGDISGLTQINRIGFLQKAVHSSALDGRLVYGSDWPLQFRLLVSPWYQLGRLPLADIGYLVGIENEWDRDIQLKSALGASEDIFLRSQALIQTTGAQSPDLPSAVLPAEPD